MAEDRGNDPRTDLVDRAELHGALGEPVRLGIVEDLVRSDRTASELGARFELRSNLLAHHLGVLERAGLIDRIPSSGDRRRRYVRVRRERLDLVHPATSASPPRAADGRIVFICTQNSARSQLAAALWTDRTGRAAASAGTEPATRVHPLAVVAARRAGLDLGAATPRRLASGDLDADLVITVCDRAHEELVPGPEWLHWSIADPARSRSRAAFDETVRTLDQRIDALL